MAKKEKRFKVVHTDGGFGTTAKILVDTETGVNYLWYQEGYAGGLTVLCNRDGSPVITAKSQLFEE